MKQLDEIKAILAPDGCWQIQEDILEILQQEINRLPNKKDVSEQQCRYPETPAAMRAFLEKFLFDISFKCRTLCLQMMYSSLS